MTQLDAELKLADSYAAYTKFITEAYYTGKSLAEGLKEFYKQSRGALLLEDHRVKQMYRKLTELNEHLSMYLISTQDNIDFLNFAVEKILDNL